MMNCCISSVPFITYSFITYSFITYSFITHRFRSASTRVASLAPFLGHSVYYRPDTRSLRASRCVSTQILVPGLWRNRHVSPRDRLALIKFSPHPLG